MSLFSRVSSTIRHPRTSRLARSAAISLLAISVPVTAQAQVQLPEPSTPPITIEYDLTLTSDYSTRGVSQTGGRPAVQAGVKASSGKFYAGAWASNVDFGDGTEAEFDLYAGLGAQTAGINWDLSAFGYFYAGQPKGGEYNHMEFRAAASKALGRTTLGASIYYAPDAFGTTTKAATFATLKGAYQVNDRWSLSGSVGKQWNPGPNDHVTWSFGPTYQATDKVSVDLIYSDTDSHDYGSDYNSRVVLSLNTRF